MHKANQKIFDMQKVINNLSLDFITPREFLLAAGLPQGNLCFFKIPNR